MAEFGTPLIRSDEITDISPQTKLGEGQYGKVYKGKCRGMTVAVKIPSKQDLKDADIMVLQREVQIMRYAFDCICIRLTLSWQ